MSKAEMKDLVKGFLFVGAAIWGWNQIAKRNATVRGLLN